MSTELLLASLRAYGIDPEKLTVAQALEAAELLERLAENSERQPSSHRRYVEKQIGK